MTDEVSQRVAEIIAEQAMVDASVLKPETTVEELGLDSLSLVEVIFGIEEAFDVTVPFNANDPTSSEFDLSNIEKIVAGVKLLVAEKG